MPEEQPQPDDSQPSKPLTLLRENAAYRWLYVSHALGLVGVWSQAAAVRWIVYDWSKSEAAVGAVDVAEAIPGLAVGLFAGAMADKLAPRPVIGGALLGQAALGFAIAGLLLGGLHSVWVLAVLLSLAQLLVTFEEPCRQVLQSRLVPKPTLPRAAALDAGLLNLAQVIGPALTGVGLTLVGFAAPFVFNGVLLLLALGAIMLVTRAAKGAAGPEDAKAMADGPPPGRAGGGDPALEAEAAEHQGQLAAGRYVGRSPFLLGLFILLGLFGVVAMGYTALVPAYARNTLGAEAGGYSFLQAAGGVGSLLGALLVVALASADLRRYLVPAGIAAAGGSLLLLGAIPSLADPKSQTAFLLAAAALLLNGLGVTVFISSIQAILQDFVPDVLRGRVMGLWVLVFSGSFPLGGLGAGLLAKPLGVLPVMLGTGVATLLLAAWATRAVNREVEKQEDRQEEREEQREQQEEAHAAAEDSRH